MAKFRPMVPVAEILSDERLNPRAIRVLLALYQFSDRNGECRPTRETLAQMCRLHIVCISQATAELVKLGWLTKNGSGGKSAATRYRLHVPAHIQSSPETVADSATVSPETVADSATVTAAETVADSATVSPETVADSATVSPETVADSATGKEHTIFSFIEEDLSFKEKFEEGECARRAEKFEPDLAAAEPTEPTPTRQPDLPPPPPAPELMPWEQQEDDDDVPFALEQPQKKQKPITQKQAKKFGTFVTAKKPDCVSQQTWDDFCTHRKHMKRPYAVTEKSISVSYREAKKAGISIEQALTFAIEFNWQNYNYEWHQSRIARQMEDSQPRDNRTFKQRDRDDTRARFAFMEGRSSVPPSLGFAQPPRFDGETIDVVAHEPDALQLPF